MSLNYNQISVTGAKEAYPLPKTEYYRDLTTGLTKFIFVIALTTSVSTLPTTVPNSSSSISLKEGLQLTKKRRKSLDASTDFATELHNRSISLSEEDSKLWRKIIDSKLKPGFPNF